MIAMLLTLISLEMKTHLEIFFHFQIEFVDFLAILNIFAFIFYKNILEFIKNHLGIFITLHVGLLRRFQIVDYISQNLTDVLQ